MILTDRKAVSARTLSGVLLGVLFTLGVLQPLHAQPNHLVITRLAADNGEYVEVFNPTGRSLVLESFEEVNGANNDSLNRTMNSGEFTLLCTDGVSAVDGVSCDVTMSSTLTNGGEGFRITTTTTGGGTDTDAVGPGDDPGYHEGSGIPNSGTYFVLRDTDAEGFPVDTDDNASDFTEEVDRVDLGTPKTGYSAEDPRTTVSIDTPPDGHDTATQDLTVHGSSENADAGDDVEVFVNNGLRASTSVQADSSWTASGVTLEGVGDRVKAEIDTDGVAPIADSDVVTVNFNDTNLIFPYNAVMEEEGPDNGSLSTAGDQPLEHWYVRDVNDEFAWDNGESYRGSASMSLDALEGSYEEVASETVSVQGGTEYEVRGQFKVAPNGGDTANKNIRLSLEWIDASESVLSVDRSSGRNVNSGNTWEQLNYSASSPTGAAAARVLIAGTEGSNEDADLNVDEVEFVEASPVPPRVNDLSSTATVNSPDTGVNLSWSYGSSADTFNVYRVRATADTSGASLLESVSAEPDTNTYRDDGATRGDSHFYYVTAERSSGGESDSSPSTTAPYVTFEKTPSVAGSARPGETITYTIDYTNGGFGPAEQLRIVDALPAETVLADTAEVVAGPSVADVEYSPDNGSTWRTSSYPRPDVDQVRWTVEETVDPRTSGTSGTIRFRVKIE